MGKSFLHILGTTIIVFLTLAIIFLTSGISLLTKLYAVCLIGIVMAKWHKKQISTKWGVAILGVLLLSLTLLIPYLSYTQNIRSDAMYMKEGGRSSCGSGSHSRLRFIRNNNGYKITRVCAKNGISPNDYGTQVSNCVNALTPRPNNNSRVPNPAPVTDPKIYNYCTVAVN